MVASKKKPPADLRQRVADFLSARLGSRLAGAQVCVGLSGGRDSVVLLAVLAELAPALALRLSAIHVHHGLSAHANDWLRFCQQLCDRLAIPLQTAQVAVAHDSGNGLEAAARHARYAAFADCQADFLLLAHHRDDLAETMLFNLLRGAGVLGAAGMRDERDIPRADAGERGPLRLLRPLLTSSRADIEAWAASRELRWVDDESNTDLRFSRNFLRHRIMPELAAHFAQPTLALARAANNFVEAQGLLDELAAVDWQAGLGSAQRLRLATFVSLTPERGRNLLRYALRQAGAGLPDAVALEELRRQLAAEVVNPRIELPAGAAVCYAWQGELWIEPAVPLPSQPQAWSGEASVPWAGGQIHFQPCVGSGISLAKIAAAQAAAAALSSRVGSHAGQAPQSACWLRVREGGERLKLAANRPHRTLKHLFQEMAVPPWRREWLALLWVGDELAWADGLGVAVGYACAPGEAGVLPVWSC